MQRQSLVPLRDFMLSQGSADGAGMQLLEIGSGTGRFATFVKASMIPLQPRTWSPSTRFSTVSNLFIISQHCVRQALA